MQKPGFKGCQVAHPQSQSKKVGHKFSSLASQFVLLTATLSEHKKEKRREAGRKEEDRAEGRKERGEEEEERKRKESRENPVMGAQGKGSEGSWRHVPSVDG